MPLAQIQFTQGVTTAAPGVALLGAAGTPVVATNVADLSVRRWQWEWIDVVTGSAVGPIAVVQDGAIPSLTFTPDVAGGCYMLHLTTFDSAGNMAEDYRAFGVLAASTRLRPCFRGTDTSMNFGGQKLGWKPYVDAYWVYVDALAAGLFPQPYKLPHRAVNNANGVWNPASDYEFWLQNFSLAKVLTLPASPNDGDRYAAIDIDGTAPGFVTVAGTARNIAQLDGVTAPAATLAWPTGKYARIEFEYTGTIWSPT